MTGWSVFGQQCYEARSGIESKNAPHGGSEIFSAQVEDHISYGGNKQASKPPVPRHRSGCHVKLRASRKWHKQATGNGTGDIFESGDAGKTGILLEISLSAYTVDATGGCRSSSVYWGTKDLLSSQTSAPSPVMVILMGRNHRRG